MKQSNPKFKNKVCALLAVMALLCAPALSASTGSELFDEFRSENGVEYVKVPRFLLWFGTGYTKVKGVKIPGRISGVRVLDLDGCSSKVKARFDSRVKALADSVPELLVRAKDDDGLTLVWADGDEKKIKKLYVVSDRDLVELSGSFSREKIERMMNESCAD